MVYIHKKIIGNQVYYTLRISERRGKRVITKDLCNLGNDLSKVDLALLEKKFHKEIRKSHKVLQRFLQSNIYEERAKKLKFKQQTLLQNRQLCIIEAARLHYTEKFLKLDKKTRYDLLENFLIRFAVNSTAIEGNTISLKDAARLLQEDIIPKNHTMREIYDLTNTKKVFYQLLETLPELTSQIIIEIHDRLLENIDERKGWRNHDIHILGQPFEPSPAKYIPADIRILLDWYRKNKKKLHPFVLAILFHHKFEAIHPFSDGNGRTGRMLMNLILFHQKYPPIIVNRRDRKVYLDAMNTGDKAIQKSLISTNKNYDQLLSFMTQQLQESYWDIFLF